ncbi:thioredoxin fold domain-containing protein [Sulfurimonas sp.]|uniref:thioredoxin fold domain-containing protein n=1 Tax=Sulfurimonas sp. TaxID=2022749 RepID=UPI0025F2B94D|nr:thioredoxin fold domain-containing protein [Sulfurimonas sp.]MBW6487550.1 thioredoxin fold domain-containing protein [Sulfurimonas sp.]
MNLLKTVTTLSLLACVALSANTELEKIKKLKMFASPNIKIVGMQENKSTYQIKAIVNNRGQNSSFEAFITKDLEEIIIGKGFDAKTQTQLKVSIDMKEHLSKAAYSVGDGKEEYLLFTDPECPYCQKLEKLLPSLAKHAKFHVFLYPLSFHKNAKQMSYHILSQNSLGKKQEAMHQIANGSDNYKTSKFSVKEMADLDKQLQEQMQVASLLGVSGTPAVFNTDGQDVQWVSLLQKYNIQEAIDMQGIDFLKKNNLQIELSSANPQKPLHIFVLPDGEKNLKQLDETIEKLKKTNSLYLYLISKAESKKSIDVTKAIYHQKDNKERVALITQLLKNQLPDEKILQESSKMSKDDETKYLPVYYIMQKMKIKPDVEFITIDENGNIIEN